MNNFGYQKWISYLNGPNPIGYTAYILFWDIYIHTWKYLRENRGIQILKHCQDVSQLGQFTATFFSIGVIIIIIVSHKYLASVISR